MPSRAGRPARRGSYDGDRVPLYRVRIGVSTTKISYVAWFAGRNRGRSVFRSLRLPHHANPLESARAAPLPEELLRAPFPSHFPPLLWVPVSDLYCHSGSRLCFQGAYQATTLVLVVFAKLRYDLLSRTLREPLAMDASFLVARRGGALLPGVAFPRKSEEH